MIRLRLCCTSNMLSSLLINKIKDAASLKQIDIDIKIMPDGLIPTSVANEKLDAILLSPQMDYRLASVKELCNSHGVAIGVMSMQDYGFMNGKGILEKVLKLIDELKNSPKEIENEETEPVSSPDSSQAEISTETAEIQAEPINEPVKAEQPDSSFKNSVEIQESSTISQGKSNNIYTEKANDDNIPTEQLSSNGMDINYSNYSYKNVSLNIDNFNGGNEMINKVKDLLLDAENEVYMNTNMDINLFSEEFNEISQKGVRVTVVAPDKYQKDGLQIDKLYTYSNEKSRNNTPKITLVIDNRVALVSDQKSMDGDQVKFTVTDNEILVDSIIKNIDNYIYILKLRDNINFKLRDN